VDNKKIDRMMIFDYNNKLLFFDYICHSWKEFTNEIYRHFPVMAKPCWLSPIAQQTTICKPGYLEGEK
jgi:hypothetical protein